MNKYLLAILLLMGTACFGQENDDKKFTDISVVHTGIKEPKEFINLPQQFSAVKVYDNRMEMSSIGLLQTSNAHITLLKLKQPLTEAVKEHLSLVLQNPSTGNNSQVLHCFIKKLVLSDYINTAITTEEQNLSSEKYDLAEKSGLFLILEFYLSKDSTYYPLYRFDTTITGKHSIEKDAAAYLASGLTASVRKLASLNLKSVISNSRKLSYNDIAAFNNSRFNIPILTGQPAKGLFLSFDDFKNNRATDRHFTVDKSKKGDFLYVKNEKGEDILFTDLWGYSDGKDVFIYSANNYFKLYRIDNSFRIFGAKDFTSKRVLRLNFGLADLINPNSAYSKTKTKAVYELVKTFLHLDLETGELY